MFGQGKPVDMVLAEVAAVNSFLVGAVVGKGLDEIVDNAWLLMLRETAVVSMLEAALVVEAFAVVSVDSNGNEMEYDDGSGMGTVVVEVRVLVLWTVLMTGGALVSNKIDVGTDMELRTMVPEVYMTEDAMEVGTGIVVGLRVVTTTLPQSWWIPWPRRKSPMRS